MSLRRSQATVGHRPAGGWAVTCLLLLAPFVHPATLRADVVDDLKRLNPHLQNGERIPRRDLKWMTLAESPYMFFRGTCDLYAEWFKANCQEYTGTGHVKVQLHGDVHPGNSGTYEPFGKYGSGELTYGLVDMDEAFVGPPQYDLLRAIVALRFIAAERRLTVNKQEWEYVRLAMVSGYRAGNDAPNAIMPALKDSKIVRKRLKKARKADAAEYVGSYVDLSGNQPRFRRLRIDDGELEDITIAIDDASTRDQIVTAFVEAIRRDANNDFATPYETGSDAKAQVLDAVEWVRLGSSGSQGLRKYLILTKPARAKGYPYQIMQLKQEPPCAAVRAGLVDVNQEAPRAQTVAASFSVLQNPRKALTGWAVIDNDSYLVKPKIHNGKEPKPKHIDDVGDMADMAKVLGALLGAAHRRGGRNVQNQSMNGAYSMVDQAAPCYTTMMKHYESFRAHPEVIAAKKRVQDWIAAQKEQHRISRVDN